MRIFLASHWQNCLLALLVLAVVIGCQGCTIHFKGKDVEFDAERQRVQSNRTYKLEKVTLFRVEDH